MRPRVLFGDHPTLKPTIERLIDHGRFEIAFGSLELPDIASFDLVVPLTIDQIVAARDANADGRRRAVVPDAELVEICDDKLLFCENMLAMGLGALLPELLPDPPNVFPYVRKPRRGEFGDGIRIVRRPEDDHDPSPHSFCQRPVEGAYEYVLHLLRVDGRIRYARCYRYLMADTLSVRGREQPALTIAEAEPGRALKPCADILERLGFEGTCCFNYKWEAGALRILELNPRFGGSLAGDVNAYVAAHLEALA
ncbi:hypothetical protein ACFSCW_10490 [Sphingomonas tabacisoli]|uniref:ATP-grasp domain-containing protein n=1 Tax=Sphingomonas tabacisoli TaxID=2249466 RepID=A0ABW4I4Z5_9SPHN